jgi:hypothetical protein
VRGTIWGRRFCDEGDSRPRLGLGRGFRGCDVLLGLAANVAASPFLPSYLVQNTFPLLSRRSYVGRDTASTCPECRGIIGFPRVADLETRSTHNNLPCYEKARAGSVRLKTLALDDRFMVTCLVLRVNLPCVNPMIFSYWRSCPCLNCGSKCLTPTALGNPGSRSAIGSETMLYEAGNVCA